MFSRGERSRRAVPVLLVALVLVGSMLPTRPARATSEATVERVFGADRYATAAKISESFAPGVAVVYVATGLNFPDSLAGGPVAARNGAPILLTAASRLPDPTKAALARLQPGRIVVLGGAGVVSDGVLAALRSYAPASRIGGRDRFETSAMISRSAFGPGVPVVYVATGRNYPDALSAGAAAAVQGGPLLLVNTNEIPASVAAELSYLQPGRIVVAGGPGVVSDGVVAGLQRYTGGGVTRLWGVDRYGTAAAISQSAFATAKSAYLATGLNFADAVAASPAAARIGGPLLLTNTTVLPPATTAEIARMKPSHVSILGGPAVVSDAVYAQVAQAGGYTLVGPHAFRSSAFELQSVPGEYLAYNGTTIVPPYGTLENNVYKWNYNGTWVDHPVGQAQYVVNMLRNYRLDPQQRYLDLALANANRLLERAVRHEGAVFFPYGFDFWLHGRGTMRAPWYSGMAQGIALSGFVRLYEVTGDARWLQAAHETYASFKVSRDTGGPWVTSTDRGLLWLELYPWQPLDHTYNGHNFATFGLYDYWRLTGNTETQTLLMAALTTSFEASAIVRVPGGVMNYCIAQSCLDRKVRNSDYHLVVIGQMAQLYRYTRNEAFASLADAFTRDTPNFNAEGRLVLMPGEHTGYAFDANGVRSAARTVMVSAVENPAYQQRTVPYGWVQPGNGVHMYVTEGPLAGTWVPELASRSFARGFVDRLDFYWGRPLTVAGGDVTGYEFAPDGTVTNTLTVSTGGATWEYAVSARINGQPGGLVKAGPLAGYWVALESPWTAEATGLGPMAAAAAFGAASAGEGEAGTAVPEPPMPPVDPMIPPPMPGQMDNAPDTE